jgi:hypothetical protein
MEPLLVGIKAIEQHIRLTTRRLGIVATRHILVASILQQRMAWLCQTRRLACLGSNYIVKQSFVISTSRFGVGQAAHSDCTPLGLHRIAAKVGAGWPVGTVFKSRVPVGFTWGGQPEAPIAHRIMWLDGLEPGYNRGGNVDSFHRYIYIHGVGNELTLGCPASCGCIHLVSSDLIPLFDRLPMGTLVFITQAPLLALTRPRPAFTPFFV